MPLTSFGRMLLVAVVLSSTHPRLARGLATPEPDGDARPTASADDQFCLVTHYSRNQAEFAEIAVASQRRYAARHGYLHATFRDRISGDAFVDPTAGEIDTLRGGGLYWQKLTALQRVLEDGIVDAEGTSRHCDWAMWMDADAVITNETVQLHQLLATYARPATDPPRSTAAIDVVLAAEHGLRVNSGIFFVRNAAGGHKFLAEVAGLYEAYKNSGLPDQDAVTAVAFRGPPRFFNEVPGVVEYDRVKPGFALTHPRIFNSMYRPFGPSPKSGSWAPCDFVAHISGVYSPQRPDAMRYVLSTRDSCE